jgi:hypothetical protein
MIWLALGLICMAAIIVTARPVLWVGVFLAFLLIASIFA